MGGERSDPRHPPKDVAFASEGQMAAPVTDLLDARLFARRVISTIASFFLSVPGRGILAPLEAISKEQVYPLINLNLQLCKVMPELTRSQRTRGRFEQLFKAVVGAASAEVVLARQPGSAVRPRTGSRAAYGSF